MHFYGIDSSDAKFYNNSVMINNDTLRFFVLHHTITYQYYSKAITDLSYFVPFEYDMHKVQFLSLYGKSHISNYGPSISTIRYNYLSKLLKLKIPSDTKVEYLKIFDILTQHELGYISEENICKLSKFVNDIVSESYKLVPEVAKLHQLVLDDVKHIAMGKPIHEQYELHHRNLKNLYREFKKYYVMLHLFVECCEFKDGYHGRDNFDKPDPLQRYTSIIGTIHYVSRNMLDDGILNKYGFTDNHRIFIHDDAWDPNKTIIDIIESNKNAENIMHERDIRKLLEESRERDKQYHRYDADAEEDAEEEDNK